MGVVNQAKGLQILDPTTKPEEVDAKMAPRFHSLDGRVLGILDNSKPNSDRILDAVVKLLEEKYNLAGIVRRRKSTAGRVITEELASELGRETQFVITGVGD